MKEYLTISLDGARKIVQNWVDFFKQYDIPIEINVIEVIPTIYTDSETPVSREVGFLPILVGEFANNLRLKDYQKNAEYNEDADVFKKNLDQLELLPAVLMLEKWAKYMLYDERIYVTWQLRVSYGGRFSLDNYSGITRSVLESSDEIIR